MAGNTKLRGFDTRSCAVVLTRWGGEVKVPVSEESKAAMLSACAHELPTKPKRQGIKLDAYTEYDSDYGAVKVSLNPETARALALLLTENLTAFESAEYLVNGIEEALEEHKDFTDMNEPGLTDGNTDGR